MKVIVTLVQVFVVVERDSWREGGSVESEGFVAVHTFKKKKKNKSTLKELLPRNSYMCATSFSFAVRTNAIPLKCNCSFAFDTSLSSPKKKRKEKSFYGNGKPIEETNSVSLEMLRFVFDSPLCLLHIS